MDSVNTLSSTHSGKAARILSDLFNPLFLSNMLVAMVLNVFETSSTTYWLIIGWLLLLTTLLPIAILKVLKNKGRIESLDINVKSNRFKVFVLVISAYLLFYFSLRWFGKSYPLIGTIIALLVINMTLSSFITFFWKISIHNASLASTVTFLLFFAWIYERITMPSWVNGIVVVSMLIIPVMMWARKKLGVHTWPQCIAGTLSGILVTWIEIELLIA